MKVKRTFIMIQRRKIVPILVTIFLLALIALTGCGNGSNENNGRIETDSLGSEKTSSPTESSTIADFEYSQPTGTRISIVDVEQGQRYLPANMYIDFADSEYLSGAGLNATVPATCKSTTLIDVNSGGAQMKIKGAQEGTMPESKLCGVSDNAVLTDFINSKRKLKEGRFF